MVSAKRCFTVLSLIVLFLLSINAFGYVIDDEVPDVTGRVARISFLTGDAQVRRNGATDWEVAAQNLPLVEGDEIATSLGARLEIQFDVRTFVRLEGNSVLRITTFQDQGIALSLPEGTASIRVTDFDHDRSYLEIDIPNSTIAVQRSGIYRIDVGDKNSTEARIRATDGAEARVYSDTSGFTLKNGRVATVYLSGQSSGEWNLADASVFADEFDKWALDRDAVTAKRIKDAFFDKYYDRDMAGAEDLSDYGDWVYTKKYGYVWRPYANAVGMYTDWSPYRYGHWRWIPPYGWTWVNDEPWGWATYHYGRWVWDNGYWYWTPYGYYRYRRSWWQPALVVINIISNNVCWYPLPYNHRYRNYSRNYSRNYGGGNWGGRRDNDRNNDRGGRGDRPGVVPTPTPPTRSARDAAILEERRQRMHTPAIQREVPASGVVTMSVDDFGRGRRSAQRSSTEIAKTVLSKDPDETATVVLPSIEKVEPRMSREIKTEAPPIVAGQRPVRIGAAERKTEQPLDQELRRTRILGDRTPVRVEPATPPVDNTTVPVAPTETRENRRRTGAVDRPQMPIKREEPESTTEPTFKPAPQVETKRERPQRDLPTYDTNKVEQPRSEPVQRVEQPRFEPPQRREQPTPREERRSEQPPKQEQPRIESPPRREEPRNEPPPQRETPRVEAPRREEPRSEPSRRQDSPPPSKSEPKVDKPSPSPSKTEGKKDGR